MLKIRVQGILLSCFKQKKKHHNPSAETPAPIQQPASEKLPGQYLLCFYILMIILFSLMAIVSTYAQTGHSIKGKVTDEKGEALPGALIKVKGTAQATSSGKDGVFSFQNIPPGAVLVISFIGCQTLETNLKPGQTFLPVSLSPDNTQLSEVQVVSTGYQQLPKERATGSFTFIDNKTLNRAVSPDLISRLNGVTNGLLVDKTVGFNIRGRNTIFANTAPLVVIDNFPFEGDINTINPNDVETVTLLKDAAAASIWGVRAGNGVLVITTKKGRANEKTKVELNSNLTVGAKPDLYYQPQLSSGEFIDLEKFRFENNDYQAPLFFDFETISPVVAELQKAKLDPSYQAQANAVINSLRNLDIRDQLDKYFYRHSARQQYNAAIRGGSDSQTFSFSAGYDQNQPAEVYLSDSRVSLKANNSYGLLNNRLNLSSDITFIQSKSRNTNAYGYTPYLPYEQIASADGNPLETLRSGGLRSGYTDTAGNGRLLDWKFRPLQELRDKSSASNSGSTDYRILLGLTYKIIQPLSIAVHYQYFNSSRRGELSFGRESFYTRNLINSVSQINSTTGQVTRPIETGDVYTPSFTRYKGSYGRGQLNFSETLAGKHSVSAIAGYEVREDESKSNSYTLFGYNPQTGTSALVDVVKQYPYYYGYSTLTIGNRSNQSGSLNRYISWYANASYMYDNRYILSGSYRKDESNLFGVKANQKGVPLWSAGIAWNVHRESFFDISWLSSLQLKATYGYNGNVNQSVSAYLTAKAEGLNPHYNANYYSIVNPPNDDLRWERVRNTNIGLDFAALNNRLSGSLEYYVKKGTDLIGQSPIAPQSGVSVFTGNSADTQTQGTEIQINSLNINRRFRWNSTVIFNHVKDKVTAYKVNPGTNASLMAAGINPVAGYPVLSVFGFKWHGLDDTGEPVGELGGEESKDYTAILNSSDYNQLDFHGSAVPTVFGSFRNTFALKKWELSFNLVYKLGYYFRRGSFTSLSNYQQADYSKRWQKPGDELTTFVPALKYPVESVRNSFYQYASVLVEKADHVRLQDIQLNYTVVNSSRRTLPFSALNIYCFMSNPGVLWKANKNGIDPNQGDTGYPQPETVALGVKVNF